MTAVGTFSSCIGSALQLGTSNPRGFDDMTQIVNTISNDGALLRFQSYADFLEKYHNHLCVGYTFLLCLGKDHDIVEMNQRELPLNTK